MTMANKQNADSQIQQVLDALDPYQTAHPEAQVDVRRQNSVSLRIRIIDPQFHGQDRVDREPKIWNCLKKLPEDIFSNITMLLLLAPDETEGSMANREFEEPVPSRL